MHQEQQPSAGPAPATQPQESVINCSNLHCKDDDDEIRRMLFKNRKGREEEIMTDTTTSTSTLLISGEEAESSSFKKETVDPQRLTADSVYDFYFQELIPAIAASLPILFHRLLADSKEWLQLTWTKMWHFLIPAFYESHEKWLPAPPNFTLLWEQTVHSTSGAGDTLSITDFMLRYFDTNGDGHISSSELLNMTEIVSRLQTPQTQTFWAWFSREWPLMDWKVGVFLWRSFGGLLVVIAIFSIIPGRLHSLSGKILRWPVLGLTYGLILVELIVYIIIRLAIRIAETIIARPKHRSLRRKMAQAESYETWYQYATALDLSQKRDKWQRTVNDGTSCRYNWAFIRQLMRDLRDARSKNDSLLALAVLQQCTRKNVGGIMSEDLFSYTYTGEPKYIVKEFIEEVAKTMRWVTDEAMKHSHDLEKTKKVKKMDERKAMVSYEESLERRVRKEKDKIWGVGNLLGAVLSFVDGSGSKDDSSDEIDFDKSILRERLASHEELSTANASDVGSETIPMALPAFHKEHLVAFLKRARAEYGRTALCLSGGAMMGLYHFGHVLGLMETDSLPNIISGTSAGSVIGAIICTRTDEELKRDLTPEALGGKLKCFSRSWPDRIKSLWKNGCMFDFEQWLDMIQWFTCGDLTFEEAYKKTGRTFCITLSSTTKKAPPVLLNYISAPNVTIASAVIASAAVPGFVPPVRLQYKDANGIVRIQTGIKGETYFDGSIEQDIPINGLAEMLNCNFFVACQTNPHVVPFFFDSKGGVGRPSRWSGYGQEASWRGGFLLAALEMYLKVDMKAKMKFLNDLEAAVGFTSTMMTQEFVGSTTIVPQVRFADYFQLFSDPKDNDLERFFQAGSVAAFQHSAMIRMHYSVADALDECLEKLGAGDSGMKVSRRAKFEQNTKIATAVAQFDSHKLRRPSMPAVITAALNDRLEDLSDESTAISEDD